MRPKISSISHDEMAVITDESKLVVEFIKSNSDKITSVKDEFITNINEEEPLNNDAEQMLIGIHDLITAFKTKTIEVDADESELGLCLGHTASVFAAEYLGWDLSFLASDYWPKGEIAVISKDKKYTLYLAIHIFMFLRGEETENKFIEKLKAFKAGEFPADAKGKFSVIL